MIKLINAKIYQDDHYIDSICISDEGKFSSCTNKHYVEIDMHGRYIYPAFVDCHLHLLGYGQNLARLSVKGLENKEAILHYIINNRHHNPIYIENYAPLEITSKDLDTICDDKPIYLRHQDFHGLTVNTWVLKALGITSKDGILLEEEATKVLQSIPKHSKETLKDYLKLAYDTLLSYGIVAGHSDDLYYFNGFEETTDVFLEASAIYPFYSHLLIHHKTLDDYQVSVKRGQLNAYIELGAVKMFYDGTTTSKTALMLHPYKDGTYGERIQKQEDFIALVKKARALDLAVAVHVIGDLGLEEVLNILKTYPVKNGLKDRIIHASYASKKAIELLKTIPCFIDYQPQFVTTDFPETLDVFSKDPDYIFPLKTYHDKKIAYGLSSDAPVEIPNPLVGMYAATLRKNEKGQYQSHERITLKEAFLGYTKHAWSLTPYKAGEIKEGFHAHFIVLDADLFSIDLEKLKTLSVKQTWIDGKKVFENT